MLFLIYKERLFLCMSMKRRQPLLFALLVLIFLGGGVWIFTDRRQNKNVIPTQPVDNRVIQVEMKGAVVQPGLYNLNKDSRVLDALAAAGGLAPGADPHMNLAEHLYDGQRLEIPYLNDTHPPVITESPAVAMLVDDSMKSVSAGMDASEVVTIPSPTSTPGSDLCSKPVVGSGVFMWPVQARFLSGNDYSPDHPGIDIAASVGSPVYAVDSGVISLEGNDDTGYGNIIQIDHGNGYVTVYAHLSAIEVQACKSVYIGQRIGLAGNSGNADGAHLHFEVIQEDEYIDPWLVLPDP